MAGELYEFMSEKKNLALPVSFTMDPATLVKKTLYFAGRTVRETGQALDRLGCVLQGRLAYKEQRTRFWRLEGLSPATESLFQ